MGLKNFLCLFHHLMLVSEVIDLPMEHNSLYYLRLKLSTQVTPHEVSDKIPHQNFWLAK